MTNFEQISQSLEVAAHELFFFRPSDCVFTGTTQENNHYMSLDGGFYRTAEQAIIANTSWLNSEVSP